MGKPPLVLLTASNANETKGVNVYDCEIPATSCYCLRIFEKGQLHLTLHCFSSLFGTSFLFCLGNNQLVRLAHRNSLFMLGL